VPHFYSYSVAVCVNVTTLNKKNKWIAASLGFVQLALFGNVALAQEVKTLNEVVVTTKNDQKQSQTGKVVSIITSEELSRSSGRSLAELLNQQAGITIGGVGSNASKEKSLFIRGAASTYTIVLMDGVLISDPSGPGGAFDPRLLAIDQIERIEILRGGQSTLYGSDAVAGVINIITKKPTKDKFAINGVLSAGSFDTYKANIGVSGKVDLLNYNVNYTYFNTNGISEAANPAGDDRVFDKDGVVQNALNTNFSLAVTDRLTINPFFRYMKGKFDYDDDAFTDANNVSTSAHLNAGVNAVYQFSEAKLTLNYSNQNIKRSYKSTYGGNYEGNMNLIDGFYNQIISKNANFLVGIENRNTNVVYDINASVNKPSVNLFSGYGSLFLHDLGNFNIELGGRYNNHNQYGNNLTYAVTPSYQVHNAVKLFGTVSSAFRAPTLDMLFGQWGANLNLQPEKSTSYEAGAVVNLIENKLNFRLVGFKRLMDNAIIYGAKGYINQDEQQDQGLEFEPSLKLSKLTLNGYYAYVEGKQTSGNVISTVLLRRPKHTFGLNVGLQLNQNWYVSTNYKYTGDRVDADFSVYPNVNRTLDAYHMIDFYSQYQIKANKLKVFVDFKNVTNQKYTELIGFSTMGFNINAGVSFNLNSF
jgi:vitamin B12 transporter